VEAKWYKARKCYRVWVPARLSEKGKDCRRFFETKEQAEKFIFETKRSGSVELAELAVEEKHILGVIRQSQKYEPKLLLEAWQRFEKEEIGEDGNLTVRELVEKFVARQKAQGRSTRTLIDDRSRLKAMTNVMGHIRAGAVKRADILRYMEGIAPGTNRRSHHKTLRKLWLWAHDLGHVGNDPMAKLKPLDEWGVNNEVLSPELFQRFLRVVQGLEAPRDGLEGTKKYKRLLPYLVLGGLQGLRTCEMIRERTKDPVIEWRDFLWKKELILVRDEVAKQTRARDRLRYVPIESATIRLLKPLAAAGAVIPVADSTFYGLRQKLCKEMRVRWPENCLRNSYATYAQTFRSSGDVARAMGDAESTVKRFYVRTLEPGVGKEWFDLSHEVLVGSSPQVSEKQNNVPSV
jgi:integrase